MNLHRIWGGNSRKRKTNSSSSASKKAKVSTSPIIATSLSKPEVPSSPESLETGDLCQYCGRPEPKKGEPMNDSSLLQALEVIGPLGVNGPARVHYCCVFFAKQLKQVDPPTMETTFGFRPGDIAKNLEKCAKSKCTFCKKPYAASSCAKCSMAFHFPCGAENGVMFDYEKFVAYCPRHCPMQKPDSPEAFNDTSSFDSRCLICQDDVICEPGINQHRSACCRHWFHRACLQQYAFSAASHHLKCPLCNDVDEFRRELLKFGFHIPLRDAAWERDPDNYRQMYEAAFVCYARTCIAPNRSFDGGPTSVYDQLVCSVCGNNAAHRSCTITAALGDKWICLDCDPSRTCDSGDEVDIDERRYL